MQITWNEIKSFLENEQIQFKQINTLSEKNFEVASLFSPINQGFYFYNGKTNFPDNIKNSLVLVNSSQVANCLNTFIFIEEQDVQLIYYKLLNTNIKQSSTRKINSMNEIDSRTQ